VLPYIYEDIISADFDCIAVDADGRVGRQLSVRHIVFPTVPGTYNDLAFELALAQRTAPVQAYIIDCKELTCDVGQCNVLTI
jgi:hypothetical protein